MKGVVQSIVSRAVPLACQLDLLREASHSAGRSPRLRAWGGRHLGLTGPALSDWVARASWGLMAGEVLRRHLYDENKRPSALKLVDQPDWQAIDDARQHGGVILVAAHIGPPKTAMNCLVDRNMPLLVWTATKGLPAWLPQRANARFLDPLHAEQRAVLLVKSALHLRAGGVLFGAPDWPTGSRTIDLDRLGIHWRFSLGIPALAKRLGLPAIFVRALWHENRIRLECSSITAPDKCLPEEEWFRVWLERYWAEIEKIVLTSPENLRFLWWAEQGAFKQELGL